MHNDESTMPLPPGLNVFELSVFEHCALSIVH